MLFSIGLLLIASGILIDKINQDWYIKKNLCWDLANIALLYNLFFIFNWNNFCCETLIPCLLIGNMTLFCFLTTAMAAILGKYK